MTLPALGRVAGRGKCSTSSIDRPILDQDESEEEDETDVMMRASRSPRVPSRKSCDISSADSDSSSDWDSSSDDGDDVSKWLARGQS